MKIIKTKWVLPTYILSREEDFVPFGFNLNEISSYVKCVDNSEFTSLFLKGQQDPWLIAMSVEKLEGIIQEHAHEIILIDTIK